LDLRLRKCNPHKVAQDYTQSTPPDEEKSENPQEQLPTLQLSTPQAAPIPGDGLDYVSLPEIEHVYPAASFLNPQEGSVSFWLKFMGDQPQQTAILFHSDDSRFVIYSDVITQSSPNILARRIIARAGGNRQVLDPFYGSAKFPEVNAILDGKSNTDHLFPYNEWHLVTMTWNGYPEGDVKLFLDDMLVGETKFTQNHDNRYRWPIQLAVGVRPREWMGELIQRHDGTLSELHPQNTSPVTESGKEMWDLQLYRIALSKSQIQQILAKNEDGIGP